MLWAEQACLASYIYSCSALALSFLIANPRRRMEGRKNEEERSNRPRVGHLLSKRLPATKETAEESRLHTYAPATRILRNIYSIQGYLYTFFSVKIGISTFKLVINNFKMRLINSKIEINLIKFLN